jgi:hypothetical protein
MILVFVWAIKPGNLLAQTEGECAHIYGWVANEVKPPAQSSDTCQSSLNLISYYKSILAHPKLNNCEKLRSDLRATIAAAEAEYNKFCGQGKIDSGNGNNQTEDPQSVQNAEVARRLQQSQAIVNDGMANIDQQLMQRDQLYDGFSSAIDQANQLGGFGENGDVKSSRELYPVNKSSENYIRHSNQMLLALLELISHPYTDRLSPRRIAGRTDKHTGVTTWWGLSLEYISNAISTPVGYDISSLNAHTPPAFGNIQGGGDQYHDLSNKLDIDELYKEISAYLKQMPSGNTEMKFIDQTGKNIYITHIPMHDILKSPNLDKALHYLRDFSW